MEVGIYGGSFNPIHRGHISLAKQILRKARLDEVWFLVSPQNPFKQADPSLLDEQLRLYLTQKALQKEDQLVASDYEFHLPRPSYTYHTLCSLTKDYPQHNFYLIIGADNWHSFPRWYCAQQIINSYPVIIYPRQGFPIDPQALPPGIQLVNTRLYPYSSTDIRQRIQQHLPVARLLPRSAAQDIITTYSELCV